MSNYRDRFLNQSLLRTIAQSICLPSICTLCNQYHNGRFAICTQCQEHLTPIGHACYHCALPLTAGYFLICGQCCKKKPYVDQLIAAYCFVEPLRTLLHEFKYQEGLYLCAFLAALIADVITPDARKTECLIPVPMHPQRLRQRGFNQAAELAKKLGQTLKLPHEQACCIKKINTAPQISLNEKERKKNLVNTFYTEPLKYKHVTIIDDIVTTGSTVNALAETLKKQGGVKKVDVWCCARTSL